MAVKATRYLTFVLFLALTVASLTPAVGVPPVYASSGSGATGNGDPDTPTDKGPKPAVTSTPVLVSNTARSDDDPVIARQRDVRAIEDALVRFILSSLLGRPGLTL
jgi:hypothetical protein